MHSFQGERTRESIDGFVDRHSNWDSILQSKQGTMNVNGIKASDEVIYAERVQ